jgi:hypothetical protein
MIINKNKKNGKIIFLFLDPSVEILTQSLYLFYSSLDRN